MTTKITLSAAALFQGSLYALQQCGLLLNDAICLFDDGRYVTSAGIAMLAREELGRHKILLELWREANNGVSPTVKQVRDRCKDHVTKQQAAQLSVTMTGSRDDQVGRLLWKKLEPKVGSPEFDADDDQLNVLTEHRKKTRPTARHTMRMKAFYVDLDSDGSWILPSTSDSGTCANEVNDAVNDYANALQRLTPGLQIEQTFTTALAEWTDAPQIPPPRWPNRDAFFAVFEKKMEPMADKKESDSKG